MALACRLLLAVGRCLVRFCVMHADCIVFVICCVDWLLSLVLCCRLMCVTCCLVFAMCFAFGIGGSPYVACSLVAVVVCGIVC